MLSATVLRRALPLVLLAVPPLASTPVASGFSRKSPVAQSPPPKGGISPPLKSGISLVSLDFLAIGRDGQPIPDLKAEEVSLKLGGRARPLTAVNLVDVWDPTEILRLMSAEGLGVTGDTFFPFFGATLEPQADGTIGSDIFVAAEN